MRFDGRYRIVGGQSWNGGQRQNFEAAGFVDATEKMIEWAVELGTKPSQIDSIEVQLTREGRGVGIPA